MVAQSFSKEIVETKPCLYGIMSYFKTDEVIGRSLREYGEWAQFEIELLADLIKSGDTVVDVGAFIGTHTLAFSRLVGSEGKVHAFEPHPDAFLLLQRNVRENHIPNVVLSNIALSDMRKMEELRVARGWETNNPGEFSILDRPERAEGFEEVHIELASLDSFDFEECSLIKIDVEGMEHQALRGAVQTLRRCHPFVYAECLSVHHGWELVSFMSREGYEAHLHNAASYNPGNFREEVSNFFGVARETNILFTPSEVASRAREVHEWYGSLIPIRTADDLTLGLLKKPQYKYEILQYTDAAQTLGNEFWANEPEKRLADEIRTESESLQEDLAEIQEEAAEVKNRNEFLETENIQLQRELSSVEEERSRLEEGIAAIKRTAKSDAQESEESKARVGQLRNEMAWITTSRSWRITRPLRFIGGLARVAISPPFARSSQVSTEKQSGSVAAKLVSSRKAENSTDKFQYHIERADADSGIVHARGWAFHSTKSVVSAELLFGGLVPAHPVRISYGIERLDVFGNHRHPSSMRSGFAGKVSVPSSGYSLSGLRFTLQGGEEITLELERPHIGRKFVRSAAMVFRDVKAQSLSKAAKAANDLLHGETKYLPEGDRSASSKREERIRGDFDLVNSARHFVSGDLEFPALDEEIDIVVPVFDGMDFLPSLFESIISGTDSPYRLILIDDASSDPRVNPYLKSIVDQNPNWIMLRNERNEGFVKSVNIATRHVRNHFILLNSDVEVPGSWLQRLMSPIIQDPQIASTTPFTNAGTVCSFPYPNIDNNLFEGLTVGQLDSVFRRVDPKSISIELPSGIGFCMGINLRTWKQIGPFDEDRFGLGYGEENDWSMRARVAGYRNVMVPNLFVSHKHGASFGRVAKSKLTAENLQKVFQLHPTYSSLVNEFVAIDPPAPLRRFLMLLLGSMASLHGPLLVIDHELGGGANAYRRQMIAERITSGDSVLLLTVKPDLRTAKLTCLFKGHEVEFEVDGIDDLLALKEYLNIGEIFYNNLVGYPEPLLAVDSIRELKSQSEATLTIAIHDYFPVCPSYTLLDYKGRYCGVPDITYCRECLPANPFSPEFTDRSIEEWRRSWGELLGVADRIICFSESSRELLQRAYNVGDEKITVRPHKNLIHFSKRPNLALERPLNIGVVGGISYAKGAQIVVETARILAEEWPDARVTVFGTLNGAPELSNLIVTGRYEPSELPNLFERYGVNVSLFPSVWPETFSYVLSELMELGIPICCFGLGAQAERLTEYEFGHVITKVDARTVVDEVVLFLDLLRKGRSPGKHPRDGEPS